GSTRVLRDSGDAEATQQEHHCRHDLSRSSPLPHDEPSSPNRETIGREDLYSCRSQKGTAMRACMLFVTGLLVGVALHTVAAEGPSPNKGIVGVNHIGMNVPNVEEAVAFYTKTMGFPEAFRVNDDRGQRRLVYVQFSKT